MLKKFEKCNNDFESTCFTGQHLQPSSFLQQSINAVLQPTICTLSTISALSINNSSNLTTNSVTSTSKLSQDILLQITNFELRPIQELKLQFKMAKLQFGMFKEDSLKVMRAMLERVKLQEKGGEGHIAKQCTAKKWVKDSEWFKDKMLLAQAQEARVVLNDEQQDFLADSLEETNDYEDLQLQATANFKADHVDAYELYCDDEATTNAIFMVNLSHVCSINDETVEPCDDSYTLSEVPHYDTYHESDMLNSNVQEMGYIENIVSNNESYDELISNSNVISYVDYMVTIGNDADNYVPPPI
ncbi:hypothetical protein Tco_1046726 [Tanacetum coccineum]